MTTISDRALLMGWVWRSRLIAPARQKPAKIKKRTKCMGPSKCSVSLRLKHAPFKLLQPVMRDNNKLRRTRGYGRAKPDCNLRKDSHYQAGSHDVEHGYRYQVLPTVAHELVITEAR